MNCLRTISLRRLVIFIFIVVISAICIHNNGIFDHNFMQADDPNQLKNILHHKFKSEENIFFVETSGSVNKSKLAAVNSRQACSIESAALTNPQLSVFLVFSEKTTTKELKIFDVLREYKNIFLLRMNLEEFANGTILESLVTSRKVYDSLFLMETMSDVLRYLLLWRYGGYYLDVDAIVQTSMENINEESFACCETPRYSAKATFASGIIKMTGEGGHKFAEECLKYLMTNFNGHKWTATGPVVLGKTFKKLCKVTNDAQSMPQKCENFRMFTKEKCYEIHYNEWRKFFEVKKADEVMRRVKNSFFVHIWSHLNANRKLSKTKNAGTAYIRLAKKFCPKVLEASDDQF